MESEISTYLGGMSASAMRIMLLEDEESHAEILVKLLKKLGFHRISHFVEAESALKSMEDCKYDLILTDGNLPGRSGLELVAFIRDSFETAAYSIPIIMLTCNRESSYVMKAKAAGVDQFIAKPFEMDTLREKIHLAFEERRPVILQSRDVVTLAVNRTAQES